MAEGEPLPTVEEMLARTDWPGRTSVFQALGQRWQIMTDDPDLAGFLDELYAVMAVDPPPGDAGAGEAVYRVVPPHGGQQGIVLRGEQTIGSPFSRSHTMGLLQWAVNRQVIEHACTQRLVLHAGGVVRDGAAVVLPAEMESGKTTLTTGLLDRGLHYLSDEAVAVDDDLAVEGYAKPLSIDRGSWEVLAHHRPLLSDALEAYIRSQWQVPAQTIAPVADGGRLAALVLPRYEAGAQTRVERLTGADAVAALVGCVFSPLGLTIPTARVQLLTRLVLAVPVHRLVSGDLDAACAEVERILAEVS